MSINHDNYHAFMVRLWRDSEGARWRASVHDPHTGKTQQFGTVDELFIYLNQKVTETDEMPIWHRLP